MVFVSLVCALVWCVVEFCTLQILISRNDPSPDTVYLLKWTEMRVLEAAGYRQRVEEKLVECDLLWDGLSEKDRRFVEKRREGIDRRYFRSTRYPRV